MIAGMHGLGYHQSGTLGGRLNLRRLFGICRQRLFTQYVLTRLDGGDGPFSVDADRQRQLYRIDIRVGQQAVKTAI